MLGIDSSGNLISHTKMLAGNVPMIPSVYSFEMAKVCRRSSYDLVPLLALELSCSGD